MEKLLSNGMKRQSVPAAYIQPPEKCPGKLGLPAYKNAPVIELGVNGFDRSNTIQKIIKAAQEFGFFQITNHGISERLINETMGVAKEFFQMPVEDRLSLYSDDLLQPVRLYSSVGYEKEEKHYWRDVLRHQCHPIEEFVHLWPSKPNNYREVVAAFSVKVRALSLQLLELISEGLGLKTNYFDGELSSVQSIAINYYPQCPDPSLTLGLPQHIDPNLITLLLQENVFGLQVLKDGEWIDVEPLPHAFVVILGHQLQIISNDKLKGVEHRVLTNSNTARTTIAAQVHPSAEFIIKPAEEVLVDHEGNISAKYKPFTYKEFVFAYFAAGADKENSAKPFKLHA